MQPTITKIDDKTISVTSTPQTVSYTLDQLHIQERTLQRSLTNITSQLGLIQELITQAQNLGIKTSAQVNTEKAVTKSSIDSKVESINI